MPDPTSHEAAPCLNRALLAASERCQSDIAQSVHGTLCQTLGGAALMVEVLAAGLEAGHPVEVAQLDELGESLDRALDEARHLFNQLQPVTPGEDGLMTALSRLAEETAKETPCVFICEDAVFVQDREAALSLFRIAQEAVRNALQRSEADHLEISLIDRDGVISLEVSDNGTGAVAADCESMRARAEAADGTLSISNASSSAGTTVTFTLPKK